MNAAGTVKLPKLRSGRWAVVKPPRIEVKRGEDNVYGLYVDRVLVGTAKRHPSGLGWKVKPEHGRQRRAPSLVEAMDLLRVLDQEWNSRSAQ